MRAARNQIPFLLVGWALGWTLLADSPAAPADYAVPPAPLKVADLGLPPVSAPEGAGQPTDSGSLRSLRDQAILAFQQARFQESLEALDRMATTTTLAPNLLWLQAWSATYANQDERAYTAWSTLSQRDPTNATPLEWMGWHAFRLGRVDEAAACYAAALRLQPAQGRLLLMAGLCAWRQDRTATAQRYLVQAMQVREPQPESMVAMAAMQAEAQHYPEAAGWLRRALSRLDPEACRHWLTRDDFQTMAETWTAGWSTLVNEFSPDLVNHPAFTTIDPSPASPTPGTSPDQRSPTAGLLKLSPFQGDFSTRMAMIRNYQTEYFLKRLRADEQLPDSSLGRYETLDEWR